MLMYPAAHISSWVANDSVKSAQSPMCRGPRYNEMLHALYSMCENLSLPTFALPHIKSSSFYACSPAFTPPHPTPNLRGLQIDLPALL